MMGLEEIPRALRLVRMILRQDLVEKRIEAWLELELC